MPKVFLVAHIPANEIEGFLQMVRAWEGGRKEIEMAIRIDDAGNVEKAEDMLKSLVPEFPHFAKFKK